jgi:hypothetical protein
MFNINVELGASFELWFKIVQGLEMVGLPCHLGSDVFAALVRLARITAHFLYDEGPA